MYKKYRLRRNKTTYFFAFKSISRKIRQLYLLKANYRHLLSMVLRFMTSSFLLIHFWSSEFGFLFEPLVYLRIWRNNLILECLLKRSSASLGHQPSIFKIYTSVYVQLSPMAFCSARREALSQSTIGKTLEGAVYPSETKRLFHHFNVWNSWPFRWTLTAISHHPTTFLFVVVLFEPLPKLRTIPKWRRLTISIMQYLLTIFELLQKF